MTVQSHKAKRTRQGQTFDSSHLVKKILRAFKELAAELELPPPDSCLWLEEYDLVMDWDATPVLETYLVRLPALTDLHGWWAPGPRYRATALASELEAEVGAEVAVEFK